MTNCTLTPMSLTNMRSLDVTAVDLYCSCGHLACVDVSALPGDLAVPDVMRWNGPLRQHLVLKRGRCSNTTKEGPFHQVC